MEASGLWFEFDKLLLKVVISLKLREFRVFRQENKTVLYKLAAWSTIVMLIKQSALFMMMYSCLENHF